MTVSTFSITASGNDGGTISTPNATYASVVCASGSVTGATEGAIRTLFAGEFYIWYVHLRWDTSSIPDADAVSAASLRLYVTLLQDEDNRNLQADWNDFGAALDCSDWVHDAPTADAIAGADITTLTVSANNTLALSNLSNINKTGVTGIRVHVSGGQPAARNRVDLSMFDHATLDEPQLSVTHAPPATPRSQAVIIG